MWSASALRAGGSCRITQRWRNLASSFALNRSFSSSIAEGSGGGFEKATEELLSLAEVEKTLSDVGADDVKVIQAPKRCEFTDYMVIATGRSPWHVRNISQALIYKVKQKQKGAKRILLPTVVGQEGGKWIVIDSGKLIVHAVDEKARAYYNFEGLWSKNNSNTDHYQDELDKAFIKIRPTRNNTKRRTSQPPHSSQSSCSRSTSYK